MKNSENRRSLLLLISLLLIIFYSACSTIPTQPTSSQELEGVNMSTIELNIRLNEFEKYFMSRVEEAADQIINETDNDKIKMNALEWKINIFPRVMESLLILSPRAVGIDLYALSGQMLNFFKSGNGKNLFGKYQDIAIDACEDIMNEIKKIANEYRSENYRIEGIKELNKWIEENPIQSLKFYRRSTFEVLAKSLGEEEYDLSATVGNLTEAVHDIRRQISVYANMLPRQTKWEAQLISYEVLGDSTFDKSIKNIDRLVNDINRITAIIEETPDLLTDLQISSFEEIHKQLLLTLTTLEQERAIVLNEIRNERIAVMLDINQQRIETLKKMDELVEKSINQSSVVAGGLVDKIFIRAVILLLLIVIAGFFAIKLIKR